MAHSDRLSAQDRSFLDLEGPDTHMHVAEAFVFDKGPLARPDGGLDIERIREYVHSRLHLIPRHRQRIAWIPVESHPVASTGASTPTGTSSRTCTTWCSPSTSPSASSATRRRSRP